MVSNIFIFSLLDKDNKKNGAAWEVGHLGGFKEHAEKNRNKQNRKRKMGMFPLLLPPTVQRGCTSSLQDEAPPIITQCTWAPQPHASTAAATRDPHLSVRGGSKEGKRSPRPEIPCSLWAGGYIEYSSDREVEVGIVLRHLTPKVGPGSFFLDWELPSRSQAAQCAPQPEAISPALDQKDMALQPRMSLTRGKGQAVFERVGPKLMSPPLPGSGWPHIEKRAMGCMSIVMALLRTGAGVWWRAGPRRRPGAWGGAQDRDACHQPSPERPQPRPYASTPMQNGGLRDNSRVPRALGELGLYRADAWGWREGPKPRASQKRSRTDSQANRTPQITRYEDTGQRFMG